MEEVYYVAHVTVKLPNVIAMEEFEEKLKKYVTANGELIIFDSDFCNVKND